MRPGQVAVQQNKSRRLAIGLLVLLLVDFLWVASSELTKFIFDTEDFHRPFFTTYVKTCMFIVYLFGFIVHKPWRNQCVGNQPPKGFELLSEDASISDPELSEPTFEPLRRGGDAEGVHERHELVSDAESVASTSAEVVERDQEGEDRRKRKIRFHRLSEVRRLPDGEAEAAKLSRLSYESWLRIKEIAFVAQSRLNIHKVIRLALQFCLLWFLGNYAYQVALNTSPAGLVNVVSTTSTVFTLILAALFPSCSNDRFTLSKLCVVGLNIAGVTLICLFENGSLVKWTAPVGVIWALVGAASYAVYLVLLRRNTDDEAMDISMFFGFVGFFNLVLLWPGFYILHATHVEGLYPLPNRTQFMYIALNGILGTVVSEYLWLWGCFLTSSLIATLSLSLVVPMTVIADVVLWKKSYPWQFGLGTGLIVVAFFCSALLVHYDNWDPVVVCLRRSFLRLCQYPCGLLSRLLRLCFGCCRRGKVRPDSTLDREQSEHLINA